MTNHAQHEGRRRSIIAVAATVLVAVVGAVVLFLGVHDEAGPPQPPATIAASAQSQSASAPPTSPPAATPAAKPAKGADLGRVLTASPPVAIDIPSINVSTKNIVDLGLTTDGSLAAPKDFSSVGWYSKGPSPGQLGPTILSGHVDSHNGPAIFYRLGALKPGARVNVARKDGSTATFTIDRIQRFPKNKFPTAQVYGATNRAELRLITCGGSFDPKTGHYVDNVVAFAHLVA
jgi:Sortase domain